MAQLLFLTAVLLGLSGLVKLRSSRKSGLGFSWLALLEMIAAAALGALSMAGSAATDSARWLVPGAVLLVIVSGSMHLVRVTAHRRAREERLGSRLESYVKYLSGPPETDDDS